MFLLQLPQWLAVLVIVGSVVLFNRGLSGCYATIKGFEVMRMIRRRHYILIEPGGTGEVRFVNKLMPTIETLQTIDKIYVMYNSTKFCIIAAGISGGLQG